jgi:hypothetical protein
MTPTEFESYVRKLGRLKWSTSGGTENIAGNQIDAVFRTMESTRLVEITIERSMEKVRADINKLVAARREEERSGDSYAVLCWMVMLLEPTQDQRALAKSSRVQLLSVDEFRDPLLGQTEYTHRRSDFPFGSVADPLGELEAAKITRIATPLTLRPGSKDITFQELARMVTAGEKVIVLMGDFGSGKSITTRDLYRLIESTVEDQTSPPFPLAVNLRDMWGAETADEVFMRHARRLGIESGTGLYRAWLGGFVCLLLDGFDEVAPQPWATQQVSLRAVRKKAVSAIRDILERQPGNSGMLITGRTNYFPNEEELCEAFGIPRERARIVELRELTALEAQQFLPAAKRNMAIANWLPRRPLLLTYLVGMGFVESLSDVAQEEDIGTAWAKVVEMACEREAKISKSLSASSIVDILAQLASLLRTRGDALGPISDVDLETVFRAVTEHQPDQDSWAILQRLPGVTFRPGAATGPSSHQKWLIDYEWADALSGLGLFRMCQTANFYREAVSPLKIALGSLGRMVAQAAFTHAGIGVSELLGWIHESARLDMDPTILGDLVMVAAAMGRGLTDFDGLTVRGAIIDEIDCEDEWAINVTFEDCVIRILVLGANPPDRVMLRGCVIEIVDGAASEDRLPTWVVNCAVETFRFATTNADILRLGLPEPIRFGMVILRKVYLQAGRGRQLGALSRGIEPAKQKKVQEVVERLESLGYVTTRHDRSPNIIVHPVREKIGEVRELLAAVPDRHQAPWNAL